MLRVLLGIASGGSPTTPFIEALAALRLPPAIESLQRSVAVGNFIPAQRELIAEDAVTGNFDYLFFVDDDIVLPPEALAQLVETAEADPRTAVVGGLYYSRDSMRPMVVADWDDRDTTTASIPPYTETSTDPVDAIGFGCALLRVAALRGLTAPYFPAHIYIERNARRVRQCDEDYRYCDRVRRAGWTVRLDARVRCSHYDRQHDTLAPQRWETDGETDRRRMLVTGDGGWQLVPLDPTVPRARETHTPADVVYISVD